MTDLVIRAAEAEDVEALTALYNMPGVRRGTLRMPFTGTAFARKRILEPGPNVHFVVGVAEDRLVAQGGLIRFVGRQSHVADVFLAIADDCTRRGFGRAVLDALLDLADNWLGLTRVQLEVDVDNAPAIALYETAGFAREGIARANILRDGVLVDSHIMARLRQAPRPMSAS